MLFVSMCPCLCALVCVQGALCNIQSICCYSMDHWSYYMDYFTSALALLDSGQDDSAAVTNSVTAADCDRSIDARWKVADSTLEACKAFLSLVLCENEALSKRLRGPYLAYLEFYRRLHERGEKPEEILGMSMF